MYKQDRLIFKRTIILFAQRFLKLFPQNSNKAMELIIKNT